MATGHSNSYEKRLINLLSINSKNFVINLLYIAQYSTKAVVILFKIKNG